LSRGSRGKKEKTRVKNGKEEKSVNYIDAPGNSFLDEERKKVNSYWSGGGGGVRS